MLTLVDAGEGSAVTEHAETADEIDRRREADVIDRADAWTLRRLRWSSTGLAVTGVACLALLVLARYESRWRGELLRTGAHATGQVVDLTVTHVVKGVDHTDVDIVVVDPATGEPITLTFGGVAMAYTRGEPVDVWYDPADHRHARTRTDVTDNDKATVVTGLGALLTGLAAAESLVLLGYGVAVHRLTRHGWHRTRIMGLGHRLLGRGDHRTVLHFGDRPGAVWSLHHHARAAKPGDAFVAGDGHWRAVTWPTDDRPYLARRPWTAAGAQAWARTLARRTA